MIIEYYLNSLLYSPHSIHNLEKTLKTHTFVHVYGTTNSISIIMGKKSKKGKKQHKKLRKDNDSVSVPRNDSANVIAEFDPDANENNDEDLQPYGGKERPFLDGDFVFYRNGSREGDPMLRGTIKLTSRNDFMFTSHDQKVKLIVKTDEIHPDFYQTQLRFKTGNTVLCRIEREWVISEVIREWPKEYFNDPLPFQYMCRYPLGEVCVTGTNGDIDELRTDFRFQLGDEVIFNVRKAIVIGKSPSGLSSDWIEGKITKLNPCTDKMTRHSASTYTVWHGRYACTFLHKGKEFHCHIVTDNDEHVAKADKKKNPRARLMDAIEQDCSLGHIDYLIKAFDIDVASFQELVLLKAIEYASYNALLWLQDNLDINLDDLRDENGHYLMYQLAKSRDFMRFMKRLVEIESLDHRDRPSSYIKQQDLLLEKEESFLSALLDEGNIQALDYALTPKIGMGGILVSHARVNLRKDLEILRIVAEDKEMNDVVKRDVIYMVDKLIAFHKTHLQVRQMYSIRLSSAGEHKVTEFEGANATEEVKRYIRFCWDYQDSAFMYGGCSLIRNIASMAEKGLYHLFKLFIDADESLLRLSTRTLIRGDVNEYTQEELYSDSDQYEYLNLVGILAHGDHSVYRPYSDYVKEGLHAYHFHFRRWYESDLSKENSWLSHMKDLLGKNTKFLTCCPLFEYKVALLEDDESLEGRLKILEYVVEDRELLPPHPLEVIRYRQCGVLRWMFEKSILWIDGKIDMHFVKFHQRSTLLWRLNAQSNPARQYRICAVSCDCQI